MKKSILCICAALLAGSAFAADSSPKDDVKAAGKALAEKASYSWKTSIENAGGGGGGGGGGRGGFGGPSEGKTEKGGFTWMSMTRGQNTTQGVVKGEKGAVKTDDGWKSIADITADTGGGGPNPARGMARTLSNLKLPAATVQDLADKVKELKKGEENYSGDLTEDGAKAYLTFGGRGGGGGGPDISDAKGSAKIWIKDGVVTKYAIHVQGKISFNGNDRDVDRTTTTEISDVGSTKVEVPEEAKKASS
jgi:hypothetical protein